MKAEPRPGRRVTEVVVLTTAMLSFISFWRASAIVLCDLASTAYYIGGIVEQAVGKSAPWFILAVMAFSYTIRAVYMESCSMFVRGGVYKVVKEAMGGTLAKLSASALMFDYVLTGPISAVAGGQYLAGLLNTLFPHFRIGWHLDPNSFAMVFALAATIYFWWENIKGIHESSDKALRIMQLTTVMAVVMLVWCFYTLYLHPAPLPPFTLNFSPEGLGWAKDIGWLKPVGAIGITMAFGHSLLAMSGEESLAQVYREMEAPKIKNLERTGLVIFIYSMLLTSLVSFFAVMIIPDSIRISQYSDNLLSGLAMSVVGPHWARLLLQSFVVGVGVVILAGASNTSIVGANGVLNRLAEDGILVDWFRHLHPKYGTTHRMINLFVGMQLLTIVLCRGDVYVLGEAYAFGVVWSFVFKTMAVMVLRFKNREPREFMVPGNVLIGGVEWPVGLSLIFLVLLATASMNLITKRVATISGSIFTAVFFGVFLFSEKWNERHHADAHDVHEKFNLREEKDLVHVRGEFKKPNRVLVAVRDPGNMQHLNKALSELDSDDTELVVFTSRIRTGLGLVMEEHVTMDGEEQKLFTKVLEVAEKAGKTVTPMLVVSNEPFYAIAQAAQAVGAAEVIFGESAKLTTDVQLERLAMTWGSLQTDKQPVRFRIIGPNRERGGSLAAMPVLRVTKHGERVLKTPCAPVDYDALKPELPTILKDMWATMAAARGVGLAAPQVGLSLRLSVIDVKPEGKPQRFVLINPEIVSASGEVRDEEGCLSIPGVYSKLTRAARVRVRALDENGNPWEFTGEGLLARAFQHEIDHLDGKLYVDRLPFEERLKVLDVIKNVKSTWA